MASLLKTLRCLPCLKQKLASQCLLSHFRLGSHTTWNKDWKPGPYPETEDERRAAAKKYNLIPEDYKPFPKEEGYGDYPDIEPTSTQQRDPFETFDFPDYKRNFGEPLHAEFDLYMEDRVDLLKKHPMPMWQMFLILTSVAVGLWSVVWIEINYYPREFDHVPKVFPNRGVVYYEFEAPE